jgi:methylmalonyl-CoA/ethylmalonyl-CoA epimerase
MANIKRIGHVSVVVDDMQTALAFWQDALGLDLSHIENVTAEHSQVAFLPAGGSEIELVMPTTDDSGLARFLKKRGPGMHHICMEVEDLEGMLAGLKLKGIQLINETPVIGSGGKKYAFIHPKSAGGVLVELYEVR